MPWHVVELLHAGAAANVPGQSVAVAQQVPLVQQKPLLQRPLWQATAPVSAQLPPLGKSGTQSPPLQWASTSHWPLPEQLPPQSGAT